MSFIGFKRDDIIIFSAILECADPCDFFNLTPVYRFLRVSLAYQQSMVPGNVFL